MTVQVIPLLPTPQTFTIDLAGVNYKLRFLYCNAPEAGWVMDIANGTDLTPLVCGIPLVTGADLLEQYEYLGIGGRLLVATSGDADTVPTFDSLGVMSNLFFASPSTAPVIRVARVRELGGLSGSIDSNPVLTASLNLDVPLVGNIAGGGHLLITLNGDLVGNIGGAGVLSGVLSQDLSLVGNISVGATLSLTATGASFVTTYLSSGQY